MRRRLLLAILLIFSISCLWYFESKQQHPSDTLEVQFAYPVTSISPVNSDDWESSFIANHIYYRLLPDESRPDLPAITKHLGISCNNPESNLLGDECKEVKIVFKPDNFTDCMGRSYTASDIRHEFEAILNSKGWIVPSWKRCMDDADTVCVTGKYVPDQLRRLQGVYFRFGWSKAGVNDKAHGAGPYCLIKERVTNGNLYTGTLNPKAVDNQYPSIKFHTSQDKNDHFELAIYGAKSLLMDNRRNIQIHTPLAYYVVTNPKLAKYDLPWNTGEAKKIIHNILAEKDVFFFDVPQFIKFAPTGYADKIRHHHGYKRRLVFVIPDYMPACAKLSAALNKSWKDHSNAKAKCVDIVKFVSGNVMQRKSGWDGFFVGISAGDPSHEALLYEYFNPVVSDSWTYDYSEPKKLFYLAGIGQSIVTVDGKKICNIKPNPLGLSDLFVSDLLPCNR